MSDKPLEYIRESDEQNNLEVSILKSQDFLNQKVQKSIEDDDIIRYHHSSHPYRLYKMDHHQEFQTGALACDEPAAKSHM